jgi:hypothetical protein
MKPQQVAGIASSDTLFVQRYFVSFQDTPRNLPLDFLGQSHDSWETLPDMRVPRVGESASISKTALLYAIATSEVTKL